MIISWDWDSGSWLLFFYFYPFFFLYLYYMLTLKICAGVFSGIFKTRMLKLGIHIASELLYYGIENRTLCSYSSLYLSIFIQFSLCLYLDCWEFLLHFSLQLIYCSIYIYISALLKQCSGAIVRFSDSSSSVSASASFISGSFFIKSPNFGFTFTPSFVVPSLTFC